MPDLILKPAAQSGNKIIIQDQAGGAVLTTADSGATIANIILSDDVPGSPAEGQIYYNNVNNVIRIYDGSKWKEFPVFMGSGNAVGSGGTESTFTQNSIGYKAHKFTTSANFVVSTAGFVDVLLVGGGAGGGGVNDGGGGAGGIIHGTKFYIAAGTHAVVVGTGSTGNRGHSQTFRTPNGNDSTFSTLTAKGGGGGSWHGNQPGADGGCGGGGCGNGGTDGPGGLSTQQPYYRGSPTNFTELTSYGNPGGSGYRETNSFNGNSGGGGHLGGGGGGAGSAGMDGNLGNAGNGGAGMSFDISGTLTVYAGGGGGGTQTAGKPGSGGSGIGGFGRATTTKANDGVDGTGSGGGGGGYNGSSSSQMAGDGGNGIVIIRYAT